MNRFPSCLCLAVVGLSLLATAAPVHAQDRPFRGSGTSSTNFFPFPELYCASQFTQFGRGILSIEVDSLWLDQGIVSPTRATFVSRRGNLFVDIAVEFDPDTGILLGTLTFRGGTGRFLDATGTATLTIVFDGTIGVGEFAQFEFVIDGSIDY